MAARTGETKAWHLNFGPTNVGIHQVSLNTDLRLHGGAVTASSGVQAEALSAMQAPGRKAAFNADLGRSLARAHGKGAEAVTQLLEAERAAPQRVQFGQTWLRTGQGWCLKGPRSGCWQRG